MSGISIDDVKFVLSTLRLSPPTGTKSPVHSLVDSLRPYLSQKHLATVAKATSVRQLDLLPQTFLFFKDKDDLRWESFGVTNSDKLPLKQLSQRASDSVLARGVIRMSTGKSELWLSRGPLYKGRRGLRGGAKRSIHAVLHRGRCNLDVNKMMDALSHTFDMPYELKRSICLHVLERSVESPTGPCEAIARNLWTLLGKRFASEGWSVHSFLGAGRTGVIFGIHKQKTFRALKVVALRNTRERYDFREEVRMHRRFFEAGLAPKIYTSKVYERNRSQTPCVGVGAFMMESIRGSVMDILKGPASPQQVRMFAQGIANALSRAADAGLTHGDLYEDNVAFHNGRLVLIDFGWATEQAWPTWDAFKFCRYLLRAVFKVLNNQQALDTPPLCVGEKAEGKIISVTNSQMEINLGDHLRPVRVALPPGAPRRRKGDSIIVNGADKFWACQNYRRCFNRAFLCFGLIYQSLRGRKKSKKDAEAMDKLKRVMMTTKKKVDEAKTIMYAREAVGNAYTALRSTHREMLNRYRHQLHVLAEKSA